MTKLSPLQFAIKFGAVLKAFRQSKGLSTFEAASRCCMGRDQYYHYESGQRVPSIQVFCRLLKGLECRSEDLLGDFLEKP